MAHQIIFASSPKKSTLVYKCMCYRCVFCVSEKNDVCTICKTCIFFWTDWRSQNVPYIHIFAIVGMLNYYYQKPVLSGTQKDFLIIQCISKNSLVIVKEIRLPTARDACLYYELVYCASLQSDQICFMPIVLWELEELRVPLRNVMIFAVETVTQQAMRGYG